jgi:5'-deoxynucleotidase YfbR-like HD superfamily hydrolase
MIPTRAWVRLNSGRRLNLFNPDHDSWTDADLAIGLSRTYRWGGHSIWDLPLSVAQHSLLVLALREQLHGAPLTRLQGLCELLHDAPEGLLGFDPISPVKPHLGFSFKRFDARLAAAISSRYGLPAWSVQDYAAHKRADRKAAASEAAHVAGWSWDEIRHTLQIDDCPVTDDPVPVAEDLVPWRPRTPQIVASVFIVKLRELLAPGPSTRSPGDLAEVIEREATLRRLASAFSRLPERVRRRCSRPPTGCVVRHLCLR